MWLPKGSFNLGINFLKGSFNRRMNFLNRSFNWSIFERVLQLMDEFFEWVLQLKDDFFERVLQFEGWTFLCRGGALKYKEKKTLECFMCRVRHPCEGGSSPSDQGQKPMKDILPGILNFWGKIRYENWKKFKASF